MRKIIVVLLAATLLGSAGMVVADETHPDCERDSNGDVSHTDNVYTNSQPLENEGILVACEGEQWDGQAPSNEAEGTGLITASGVGAKVNGNEEPDKDNNDATDPVSVVAMVSLGGNGYSAGDVYTMTQIFSLGNAGVFVGDCGGNKCTSVYLQDQSEQTGALDPVAEAVMDQHESDQGDHHNSDDAEGNLLALIVHYTHITQGRDVGEEHSSDPNDPQYDGCDQAEYDGDACSRDNTAITVELLLA